MVQAQLKWRTPQENGQARQDQVVKELIQNKVQRANTWKPFLPFDMTEHEENKRGDFINKVLFRDGTKENYDKIRTRQEADYLCIL